MKYIFRLFLILLLLRLGYIQGYNSSRNHALNTVGWCLKELEPNSFRKFSDCLFGNYPKDTLF